MTVTVVAGGVGAARLLAGLVQVVPAAEVTAVVNVGDDIDLHGLHVSPDLDTIVYTLGGGVDAHRGWGLVDETWNAMGSLGRYDPEGAWFSLGDHDLGTHLYRTGRLAEGAALSTVTAEIARAWALELKVLPATDDPLRTMVTLAGEGTEVSFQEYFVHRRHSVPVSAVRFEGAGSARPAPGVIESMEEAEHLVVAPSNPIVSIDPVLAVPGVRDALTDARERVVAVSPIVAGAALKGPADRLLTELGHEASVVGVARLYAPMASALVVDEADAALADAVEAEGIRCVVAPTIMRGPAEAAALAATVLGVGGTGAGR